MYSDDDETPYERQRRKEQERRITEDVKAKARYYETRKTQFKGRVEQRAVELRLAPLGDLVSRIAQLRDFSNIDALSHYADEADRDKKAIEYHACVFELNRRDSEEFRKT